MIRRRRRTATQREALAYKQAAPIGIGETRDEKKDREDAEETAVIAAVHNYIWKTRPCCQLCHGTRRAECGGLKDQMHEEPPRSATLGRPPEERFNIFVCGRVCAACHRDLTAHRLRVVFESPSLGFVAPVHAQAVP